MSYLSAIDQYLDLSNIGDVDSIFERLIRIGPDAVFGLVDALSDSLPAPRQGAGSFRYVGNSRLSGLPFPCSDPSCRTRSFSEAASFAAIYADEVVFFDPISEFKIHFTDEEDFSESDIKAIGEGLHELAFGIAEILTLRPLIERGICTFVRPPSHNFCRSCFEKGFRAIRRGSGKKTKDLYFLLAEKFASTATVTFTELKDDGRAVFEVEGIDDVVGHGLVVTSGSKAPEMAIGSKLTKYKKMRWGVTK